MQKAYRLTLNVASNFDAIKNGLLITAETRDVTSNNHLIECRGRGEIGSVFQVNSDGTVYAKGGVNTMGTDASELNDIKKSELRGIETLSKINICDFEKDGTKKTGIVADDLLNAMPSALTEYKKTVEVGSAIGNVVHGDDESELIVRANVSKQEFDDQEWPETYKFVETSACNTEEVTKLSIDQDAIIAMLIKSVQELNGKVNRLTAEVRKNK
tara:strand:- start:390 stop:1031 length:642 start_codon:yes stop_codon:yes gene_type:complete